MAAAAGVVSGAWSVFALFLRHIWSLWLVIPEFLLALGWIVLFGASSCEMPDDSKRTTFNLGMIAIEASMVLWIQTCLLMLAPFFHKLMPWLFRKRNQNISEPPDSTHGSLDMVR